MDRLKINIYVITFQKILIWQHKKKNMGRGRPGPAKRARNKISTSKLIDKITYNPNVHKNKFTKALRDRLRKPLLVNIEDRENERRTCLNFGSINIRGLDLSAENAIHQLIKTRNIDVMYEYNDI